MASPLTSSATTAAKSGLTHVDTLPTGVDTFSTATTLTYLAEGAANVIYRLSSPPGEPQYQNELLRARKALPSAQPNQLAFSHLLQTFHPLFPKHLLLPTRLVKIPASVLVRENANLRALEEQGKRPAKRRGLYLEEVKEEYGFLIMDMSPHPIPTPPASPRSPSSPNFLSRALARIPGHKKQTDPAQTRQLLIEFKPKWVLQSPSAPASWRRCRTCALRLSKAQKHSFCPLDLSSRDEVRVQRAVQYLIPAKKPASLVLANDASWEDTQGVIAERIVRYLVGGDLMPSLKKMHAELDPHGPVAVQTMDEGCKERFVTAMTVRDLTIFLRIDLDVEGGVEAKIGDLDLKTGGAGKWGYWAEVERKLTDEGWYEGTEEGAEEKGVWCTP